jgi:peptidoglycan/LPS O-acetylase OafA/YrhL
MTTTANLPHAPRLHGLDTLRAAAILLVFAYHYMVFVSRAPTFGWLSQVGWVGVDLFFVLSGYLIANQIFAGQVQGRELSLKAFYARRLLRTLPNFYVVLALYFAWPEAMGGNTPPALWRFVTFTQNVFLQPGTAFLHAWSLCIEEQFYLLLPAVALLGARHVRSVRIGWVILVGTMLAAVAVRTALWSRFGREADGAIAGYYPNIYYATWARIDEFLPGVAVAMLKNFHPALWQRVMHWPRAGFALAALCTAVMLGVMLNFYAIEGYGYGFATTAFGYSLMASAFALLTLSALTPGSLLHRVRVPGATALAAWSYAVYLTHKPIAGMVQRALAVHGVGADSGVAVAVIASACVVGGWLLYRLIETPFMTWRDRHVPSSFPFATYPTPQFSISRSTP